MKIKTAYEALVVWGEIVATGGAPLRLVQPNDLSRRSATHGLTDEQQAREWVEGTEGFHEVEGPLHCVFVLLQPRHRWPDTWENRIAEFCERLEASIGNEGWKPSPPTEEWNPWDDPKESVDHEGRVRQTSKMAA